MAVGEVVSALDVGVGDVVSALDLDVGVGDVVSALEAGEVSSNIKFWDVIILRLELRHDESCK